MDYEDNRTKHLVGLISTFYKSKRWQKKRKYILSRDSHMCRECRKYGRTTEATTVHHVTPIEKFATELLQENIDVAEFFKLSLDDKNLESLCDSCHNKKHPEKGGKRY